MNTTGVSKLFCEVQIVNILGIVGHAFSVATTQLCCGSCKAAIDNRKISGGGSVPIKLYLQGASLVVQWIGHDGPNAGGPVSIPGQGTDPTRMLQLSVHIPQLRSLPAAAKEPASTTNTQHNQINK